MNGYLLDTNVISEYSRKKSPDERLRKWVDSQNEATLYLSVLTLGEIRKGTALLPSGKKRTDLEPWLETELPDRFNNRILPITGKIAELWGGMSAQAQMKGITLGVIDGLLGATALGLEVEALEICKGSVLGFYRLDHEGGGELLQWAPEFTVETAAYALEICRDGTRLEQSPPHRGGRRKRSVLPENFVEQFVPDWAGMIERLRSKRR